LIEDQDYEGNFALAHEQGQANKARKPESQKVRKPECQGIGPNLDGTQSKYVIGRAARHEGALVSRTPWHRRVKLKMHRHDDLFALQSPRILHGAKKGPAGA